MAEDKDLHRDPISGEADSHPVGTGVGAVGGAVAGAAAGAAGGPAGMVVGGVVGALVGGLAGRAAAEAIDPAAEESHWRDNYQREPYYEQGRSYDDYAPAYRLGVTGRTRYENWDAAEPQLANEWETTRGGSALDWDNARPASQAAWARVDSSMRGGAMSTAGTADVTSMGRRNDLGLRAGGGSAAAVGNMQTAGNEGGDSDDVIDLLQDLVECSLDGEYGFRACAEQCKRQDLKAMFLQRADDCRRGAQELNEQIRASGGRVEEHGSTAGALHRGWVAVKSALSTYDDKAVLEEAERGEDNAKARYAKALQKPMPPHLKLIVESQMEGVRRNHDQVKMLRDQFRMQG
ncbi:MAG TPA: PA2169 family four-helix-bundle protein [Ramlibacter sp.]|nr:PA2169 family four-helix-bundle protein [Ramlibacter sp.]